MSDTPSDATQETVTATETSNVETAEVQTTEASPNKDNGGKNRYKNDLLKQKAANKELMDRLAALEKDKEDTRIASMREKEQFKELAEEYKTKLEDAESRQSRLNDAIILDKKISAITQAALQMGIRKEALGDLDLLDLDTVEYETTSTGRVNVLDPKGFVEDLKVTKPHWFGKRSAKLNSEDPVVIPSDGSVTVEMIRKAEREAKKSGDSSQYLSLVKRYKQQ